MLRFASSCPVATIRSPAACVVGLPSWRPGSTHHSRHPHRQYRPGQEGVDGRLRPRLRQGAPGPAPHPHHGRRRPDPRPSSWRAPAAPPVAPSGPGQGGLRHHWKIVARAASQLQVPYRLVPSFVLARAREFDDLTRDETDPRDAALIVDLVADLRFLDSQLERGVWVASG
jgi:hypothetical protein